MKKMITAVTIAAASLAAQAEGFYLGGGVGFSNSSDTAASDMSTTLVSAVGGTALTTADNSVNNVKIIGGYKVNENVAVEAGYISTSNLNMSFAGISGNSIAYTGSGKVSFSGFDVSAVLRPSVASGYNNFFATVGVHSYKAKTALSISAGGQTASQSESNSGTGTMFGAGYDWNVEKDLDLRFAVTRINKLAGESGVNVTNFGAGLIKHF
jgi:OOP family OmpA-OmpF porin